MDWNYYHYFDRFDNLTDKYLPSRGEGDNMATQIVTAVNKLIYKWYNDGDVYDNTYHMEGWCNDLSSYANWLWANTEKAPTILERIRICDSEYMYEEILKDLADALLDEEYLESMEKNPKTGSIYDCDGTFRFEEEEEDD